MQYYSLAERRKRAEVILDQLKSLFPVSKTILEYSNPLELLIAVMLSAQTTDKQVNIVTKKLFAKYTTLEDYLSVTPEVFEKDIAAINHYKTKARHIIGSAHIIKNQFAGQLPKTVDEFITLPGVGRKTAHVVMGNVYGPRIEGVAVDTHIIRLTRKWGLTNATKQLEIERDLMEVLPQDEWFHFTNRVIQYGRMYSPAHKVHDDSDVISQALKKL